ncbi:MAG: ribonuclease H-like domain-containing protein [Chloroflexi bacterium]|nr:ribonuclease H-like domain-containing protein [Chloroflexota bacterium]
MRHALAQHLPARPAAPAARDLPPIAEILRGTWHETVAGPVFLRDDWYPLEHAHGLWPLGSALRAAPGGLARLLGAAAAPVASRLAFFDIETTGLAGGSGTYIVLAGVGSYEDGAFRMRQYFLADLAGERAMLAMLAADLARFDGVVTYNGRAFDIPCVEARLTMARLPSPCGALAHIDLLHPVRRLFWHRMPDCRLAEVERRLLRISRPEDTPGWMVPRLYFEYVRAGRAAPLRGVFQHNAEDVLSLVGVLAALAALLEDDAPLDPDDAVAVARWWEYAGEATRAMALYRQALPWLEGGEDWAWASARHARLCRRYGRRAEAAEIWRTLALGGDRASALELAKHLEHHERAPLEAATLVSGLLAGASDAELPALHHRLARLRRKCLPALAVAAGGPL